MSRNRALAVCAMPILLAGCADYLNRYDTVSSAAGNTQKHNSMLQTSNPFNPASDDIAIETDGQRASDAVVWKYKNAQQAPAAPQPNVTVNVGSAGTN